MQELQQSLNNPQINFNQLFAAVLEVPRDVNPEALQEIRVEAGGTLLHLLASVVTKCYLPIMSGYIPEEYMPYDDFNTLFEILGRAPWNIDVNATDRDGLTALDQLVKVYSRAGFCCVMQLVMRGADTTKSKQKMYPGSSIQRNFQSGLSEYIIHCEKYNKQLERTVWLRFLPDANCQKRYHKDLLDWLYQRSPQNKAWPQPILDYLNDERAQLNDERTKLIDERTKKATADLCNPFQNPAAMVAENVRSGGGFGVRTGYYGSPRPLLAGPQVPLYINQHRRVEDVSFSQNASQVPLLHSQIPPRTSSPGFFPQTAAAMTSSMPYNGSQYSLQPDRFQQVRQSPPAHTYSQLPVSSHGFSPAASPDFHSAYSSYGYEGAAPWAPDFQTYPVPNPAAWVEQPSFVRQHQMPPTYVQNQEQFYSPSAAAATSSQYSSQDVRNQSNIPAPASHYNAAAVSAVPASMFYGRQTRFGRRGVPSENMFSQNGYQHRH